MNEGIVRVEGVTKQYRKTNRPAVSNLSLTISNGSVFGLLGPNGAGKSTLVMMLCGLLKPTSGSISIFNLDVGSDGAEIRKKIGVAPQEIALFPTLTAYENLFYFGRMYGLRSTEIKYSIEKYLSTFGLQVKAKEKVETFSGGMKRRLNLIAALLHQPELLILDEPTTGVDVQSRRIILDFLKRLNTEGTSIIYSSHLLEEAESLCSEIAILDEGNLLMEGAPGSLLQANPDCINLEQLFLKLTGKNIRD